MNASLIYAQDPYHITFDVDNGLPSSEVYDVISDDKHNIWISTDRGITKYDGASHLLRTTKNGLSDNTNFYFNKDKTGKIWLSGYNRTLSYIEKDSIYSYEYNEELNEQLGDAAKQWIKYLNGNLDSTYFITFQNYTGVVYYQKTKANSKNNQKESLFKIENSTFLTKDSIVNIQGDYYHFYLHQKTLFPSNWFRVSKAIRTTKNQIFFHKRKTVLKQDLASKKVEEILLPYDIERIYLDGDENLWICTRDGLFYYEGANINLSPKVFFKGLLISCIIEDFQGNYWVGTNDSGVKFIPSFDITNIDYDNKLNENFLSTFNFKEKIAFGSSKSNLVICDKEENCNTFSAPSASSNEQINKIGHWDNNSLILNTGAVFDGETFTNPNSPFLNYVIGAFCTKLDNNDHIIYTRSESFTVISTENQFRLTSNEFENPINNYLYSVAQDASENVYLGTSNGLYEVRNYDYSNNTEIFDKHGKGLGRISSIKIDANNLIWVATIGNGIYAILDDVAIKINDIESLSNPMINNLVVTEDSLLWLATNDGIDVLSYSLNDTLILKFLRNINKADGLVSTSVNDLEYWQGKIWAATNAGICNFYPNILDEEVPQIPIAITEFVNKDSMYNIEEELKFDYNQNDVFISYSGLSFQQFSEEVKYKYRLIKDGQVKANKWYYTNARSERFNDLSHGKYTFEVSAMNKLQVWNDSPAKVSFVIAPRYVDTLLFKLSMLLLLGLLLFALFRVQSYRNRQRQVRLLELEEAKRKIQEAEISAIRNQMNPHFVYNSLNSIQNLIFKNDSYGANYYLSKFSTLMRQGLQFTSVNFISLQQEFDFLSNYLELESLRFPNKFDYTFKVDSIVDTDLFLIPSLILQPIVENSIKHGFDDIDYVGNLEIEVNQKEDLLEISICDNGSGTIQRPAAKKNDDSLHKSFGTKMVQNRLDLLNRSHFDVKATVEVLSAKVGYKTLFILPIIYDHD